MGAARQQLRTRPGQGGSSACEAGPSKRVRRPSPKRRPCCRVAGPHLFSATAQRRARLVVRVHARHSSQGAPPMLWAAGAARRAALRRRPVRLPAPRVYSADAADGASCDAHSPCCCLLFPGVPKTSHVVAHTPGAACHAHPAHGRHTCAAPLTRNAVTRAQQRRRRRPIEVAVREAALVWPQSRPGRRRRVVDNRERVGDNGTWYFSLCSAAPPPASWLLTSPPRCDCQGPPAHTSVLAVPLTRRPLMPGILMPVRIRDERLVRCCSQLLE